jgi:hypothetical protein
MITESMLKRESSDFLMMTKWIYVTNWWRTLVAMADGVYDTSVN